MMFFSLLSKVIFSLRAVATIILSAGSPCKLPGNIQLSVAISGKSFNTYNPVKERYFLIQPKDGLLKIIRSFICSILSSHMEIAAMYAWVCFRLLYTLKTGPVVFYILIAKVASIKWRHQNNVIYKRSNFLVLPAL